MHLFRSFGYLKFEFNYFQLKINIEQSMRRSQVVEVTLEIFCVKTLDNKCLETSILYVMKFDGLLVKSTRKYSELTLDIGLDVQYGK